MFVIYLNLARYLEETCCVRKYKKNGYREFDHSGTLNSMSLQIKKKALNAKNLSDPYSQ